MGTADAWSTEAYAANARFVSELGAPVVALLDPQPGERILDVGCGDGALTEALAATGAEVHGVDGSADMVAAARARGLSAEVADAHALSFDAAFDAVFSNAAMHWMVRPDEVIAGCARALRPGGRLVAEFGGFGNVAAIRTAIIAVRKARHGVSTSLKDIWYFPTAEEHRARLEAAGFRVDEIALIPRPTPVRAGLAAWLETLAAPAIADLDGRERADTVAEIADLLAPALRDERGQWMADYVRLRFRATLT